MYQDGGGGKRREQRKEKKSKINLGKGRGVAGAAKERLEPMPCLNTLRLLIPEQSH